MRLAALIAFVAGIALGVMLPVYTDEIGWRFQERAGLDGVDKMFSDACGANSLARPPVFMMPVRAYSALFNTAFAAPAWVRVSGVGYALCWAVLLWLVIGRAVRDPPRRAALAAIAFGLLALGNTPLLLVLSRPEQPLILCAAAAVLLALRTGPPNAAGVGSAAIAVIALAAVAFSYHLKGLFLLPVFLAALLCLADRSGRKWPQVLAALAIVAMAAIAARYWVTRLQCPGDAVLRAEYARNSAGAALSQVHAIADVWPLLRRLIGNTALLPYAGLAAPRPVPLSGWLPAGQIDQASALAWARLLRLAWSVSLALAVIAALGAAWQAMRGGERTSAMRPEPRLLLALALLVTVLGWSATQLMRNFYEAGFVLPLLVLAMVLALAAPRGRLAPALAVGLGAALAIAAPVSVALIARTWTPGLLSAWQQSGYVARQPFSLSLRGFAAASADVSAAARLCHLPPPGGSRGLVVDELSYFPMMRTHRPQHWLGVFGGWRGEIDDPVAYLRGRRSDGILVACRHLPAGLRARALRAGQVSGQVCCLSPPDW